MKKNLITIFVLLLVLCGGIGLLGGFFDVAPIYADPVSDGHIEVSTYDDWKQCERLCRDECRNASRPAYCFDQCMRSCTD